MVSPWHTKSKQAFITFPGSYELMFQYSDCCLMADKPVEVISSATIAF